ncbi:tryptophan--tRNA ligase [Blattabacterium cuenoti]|uniref:tryptophan--tRNA ligase n=1 Tax=Blattabacterium cuenoti TaxID=1653831 RepID=UPI00163CCE20|nr:tryptophan--tRNA ligase [Blattabacterium cuenoti]
MKIMLTGIQSTGTPHLGNILGVIIPSINIANNNSKFSSFIFVADLHSLTQIKNVKEIKENTYKIVAAWLSFGLNTENSLLYRQSDVSEVTELAWYFNCFFPYKRLTLSHSFKKGIKNHIKMNVGLFTYPILMAADILLYNAETVPVGKDQLQHIEIARRIASCFNKKIGKKLFILPNPFLQTEIVSSIPGIDGQKMSKSKKNCINIFSSDKILKKQIMSIHTDNKSLKEKKDPDKDFIMSLYRLVASIDEVDEMRKKYIKGGYGYFEAKIALYECIIKKFSKEREKFSFFIKNKPFLDRILFLGAKKAKNIAFERLNDIRKALNFNLS